MAELVLNLEKRKDVGKKANKQLRKMGKIPGIYYIHGEESIPFVINAKQLHNVIHTETSILNLKFDSGKNAKCVIRDIQWDPVNDQPLHVDFMGIKLTEKVQVEIPIHLVGTPVGVKQEGGVLQQIIRELSIESLPMDIPEHVEIDVSHLNIGDTCRVEELNIEKVKILSDPSQSIASVRPPRVVVEPTVEVEEEIVEPEVVGQKKEEGEEETEEPEKTNE
ncbi:MAG: 50S ribosomal protein L25 [bacterium]